MNAGHYVAVVRHPGADRWRVHDDATTVDHEQLHTETGVRAAFTTQAIWKSAALLFYTHAQVATATPSTLAKAATGNQPPLGTRIAPQVVASQPPTSNSEVGSDDDALIELRGHFSTATFTEVVAADDASSQKTKYTCRAGFAARMIASFPLPNPGGDVARMVSDAAAGCLRSDLDAVIGNCRNCKILTSDLVTLLDDNELNDQVINFHRSLLAPTRHNDSGPRVFVARTNLFTTYLSRGYGSVHTWTKAKTL
jgi:hypothetical protein